MNQSSFPSHSDWEYICHWVRLMGKCKCCRMKEEGAGGGKERCCFALACEVPGTFLFSLPEAFVAPLTNVPFSSGKGPVSIVYGILLNAFPHISMKTRVFCLALPFCSDKPFHATPGLILLAYCCEQPDNIQAGVIPRVLGNMLSVCHPQQWCRINTTQLKCSNIYTILAVRPQVTKYFTISLCSM